jgi:hypothetical protein
LGGAPSCMPLCGLKRDALQNPKGLEQFFAEKDESTMQCRTAHRSDIWPKNLRKGDIFRQCAEHLEPPFSHPSPNALLRS